MDWLNYHHLLYFWTVAREGSVTRAGELLHLAQPTVSAQLQKLEKALGTKLFRREGRQLVLTETGRMVYEYADEIFALGRELTDALRGQPGDRPARFAVGVTEVVPKLVTFRILEPVMQMPERIQLTCTEGKLDDLLGELVAHRLDLILSDSPMPPGTPVRAFNHLLGECAVSAFGVASLAREHRKGFPGTLHGAPVLLPTPDTALRRSLDQWFDAQELRPRLVAEFRDSALLKTFGQSGTGLFFGPAAIEEEIVRQYGVQQIGRIEAVVERFYGISPERKVRHPAVSILFHGARRELF